MNEQLKGAQQQHRPQKARKKPYIKPEIVETETWGTADLHQTPHHKAQLMIQEDYDNRIINGTQASKNIQEYVQMFHPGQKPAVQFAAQQSVSKVSAWMNMNMNPPKGLPVNLSAPSFESIPNQKGAVAGPSGLVQASTPMLMGPNQIKTENPGTSRTNANSSITSNGNINHANQVYSLNEANKYVMEQYQKSHDPNAVHQWNPWLSTGAVYGDNSNLQL